MFYRVLVINFNMQFFIWIVCCYLFVKKLINVINIIIGIVVFGIVVGLVVFIFVFFVFNGFEDLIVMMYSNFNLDVKVIFVQGKIFMADMVMLEELLVLEGVVVVIMFLEEVVFFEYKDNQDFGIFKGVAFNYEKVVGIDIIVWEGVYWLKDGEKDFVIFGLGMWDKFNVNVGDFFIELGVYMFWRS